MVGKEKNKGQIPASDTFKDEHKDAEHFIRTDNVDSVDSASVEVCAVPSNKTNTKNMRRSSLKQNNNRGLKG